MDTSNDTLQAFGENTRGTLRGAIRSGRKGEVGILAGNAPLIFAALIVADAIIEGAGLVANAVRAKS